MDEEPTMPEQTSPDVEGPQMIMVELAHWNALNDQCRDAYITAGRLAVTVGQLEERLRQALAAKSE